MMYASFTGTFDGQGKTISNLFINRGSTNNVGLFGYVGSGGSVKNVGLKDPVVTGNVYVGGLVGNSIGPISACYVSGGTVTGTGNDGYVGGLVGNNNFGTISASYVSGVTVTGDYYVGGLAGHNDYGTISASYVSGGTVTGDYYVGGLVGSHEGFSHFNFGIAGIISASYVSGVTVTSTGNHGYVGGLVGYNSSGTIIASYAGGKDYANLVGRGYGTVTNSYYQAATVSDEDNADVTEPRQNRICPADA